MNYPNDFINKIICGDAIEQLKKFPSNYFDSIVTDPPAGISFMGKTWDDDKGGRDQWIKWLSEVMREGLRVLKPGGHALVWSLPRTSHWTGMALENAGFEVRDIVHHVFGCLSEDTEVLTNNGWLRYDRIQKHEDLSILTYNIDTDEYRFEIPEKWNEYTIKDTCYRIQSNHTDQIVSRNHRVLIEREGKLLFQFAEDLEQEQEANIPILESMFMLSKSVSNTHKRTSDKKPFLFTKVFRDDNSTKEKTRPNMHELWNSVQTKEQDGVRQSKVLLQQVQRGNEIKQPIIKLTSEKDCTLGKNRVDTRRYQIQKRTDDGKKEPCMEGRNNISSEEGILCECKYKICVVPHGFPQNGSERWICNGTPDNNGEATESSYSKIGMRSSYQSQSNGQSDREPDVIQEQSRPQEIRSRKSYNTTLATINPIEYSGLIFCPTVSTGCFVARRNGKIFLTGNSGFPKSLDISKQIDKQAGVEREVIGTKQHSSSLENALNNKIGYLQDDANKNNKKMFGYGEESITIPSTLKAKQWSGWGTALKPAVECWWLARKPISEDTVAENVLKYGTGGINIDGCRVPYESTKDYETLVDNYKGGLERATPETKENWTLHGGGWKLGKGIEIPNETKGRFPANLIHDGSDEVLAEFAKAGNNKGAFAPVKRGQDGKSNGIYGDFAEKGDDGKSYYNDTGTAARFFYCAKPSKSERDDGLTIQIGEDRKTPMAGRGQGGLKCEICGKWKNSGSPCVCPTPKFVEVKFESKPNLNHHPTVKAQALMEYLIKLITPPNGIVLDMFAGSGSTLIAAKKLGHPYIGIEIDAEYCEIAEQRLATILNTSSLCVRNVIHIVNDTLYKKINTPNSRIKQPIIANIFEV